MTDLAYASATTLLDLFRRREVSPVEVLEAQLCRAGKVEETVNAFVDRFGERARVEALASERRYRDGRPLPLDGITVAIKEKHALAGVRMIEGSLAWDGVVPTVDHPVVQRLRAAGAVVHARTTTPEFSIAAYTHSRAWGVTRNPWNLAMTPGGSSGGAGAALAAGTTTLATASDIGGSTRGPACFTGTVGYKAPYGRIPGSGAMTLDHYRGDGPLARTVEDALLMTNLVAGRHPHDHVSLPATQIHGRRDLRGMRIAWSRDLSMFAVDPEVAAATAAAAARLAAAGAEVVEVEIGWTRDELLTAGLGHFAQMMAAMVQRTMEQPADELSDYARAFLDMLAPLQRDVTMFDAARAEYAIQRALAEAMTGFDALVCPTSATPGLPAGDSLADGVEIDGRRVESFEALLTMPFNINNRCPVLALPSGFAANGMPLGIQVVGHPYDDETVFSIGRAWAAITTNPFDERRPNLT